MRYLALKYLSIILLFTIFTSSDLFGQEGNSGIRNNGIRYIEAEHGKIILQFSSTTPSFKRKLAGQQEYFNIEIPGLQYSQEVGSPKLPVSTEMMDITNLEIVSIKISNIESQRIYPGSRGYSGQLYPKQPGLTKNQDPQGRPFVKDRAIYKSKKATVNDTVSIEVLGTMRGQELALVKVNPVFYYPADNYFDLITGMRIEIETRPTGKSSQESKTLTTHSSKGLIDKGLIDFDEKDVTPFFSLVPSGLVILSDTSMKKHLKPLVEWKKIKGFRVIELYIGENGLERTFSSIKDTLNYIWNNSSTEKPAPDFLIIGGDLNIVPKSEGASALSDLYYSEFDGNGDYLPDMFAGRLPARDSTEMKSIIEKILQYERFEFGDTIDHYKEAMLVAGWDAGGHVAEMNGQLSYGADNYLNASNNIEQHLFLNENNDSIRNAGYASVMNLFNQGIGFVNYTGHGSPTSWLYTGIDFNLADNLSNKSRYPLIISNACETAAFNNSNNFGSSFVRAHQKGALAFIGCTVDSYWDEDFWWSVGLSTISTTPDYENSGLGFYDRLFHLNDEKPSDWFSSLGQIIYAGNLSVLSSSSSLKKYYWEYYHLLGDPSIVPYIGTPGEFNPAIPDSIPTTLKSISFTTLPFSYAAISHFDTLWDASSATPSGSVTLTIPDTEKDSCLLVITGQNMKPFIKTLYFNSPDTAWLNIIDINPDDSNGNANGRADYSENIALNIDIQNAGSQAADNVYMLLSTTSEYLTIIDDSSHIGSVGILDEMSIDNLFEISINDSIPDLEIIGFTLELYYGNNILEQRFDISIHAPEPQFVSCTIDDIGLGNGNLRPEPGEIFDIIVKMTNAGSSACEGTVSLSSLSHLLNIADDTNPTGIIQPGDTVSIAFSASLSSATPDTYPISFEAVLDCNPYFINKNLGFIAGGSIEDFELQHFLSFPWINESVSQWTIEGDDAYSNTFSAVSGYVSHSSESNLDIIVNLPETDTLKFWYKVSSESGFDYFRFYIDEQLQFDASGEEDWTEYKIEITKGVHKVRWQYKKDYSVSSGSDQARIDFIQFPKLSFIKQDIAVNKILSPSEPSKDYSHEEISVEVTNLGLDTLQFVSLTYKVNTQAEISETFIKELFPGDTAIFAFAQTANLDDIGTYSISVYCTSPDGYSLNDSTFLQVISTAIHDINIESNEFKIGPNPFSSNTNLEALSDFNNVRLSIFDFKGSPVWRKDLSMMIYGERISLPAESLSPGGYYLRIDSDKGSYLYKLVKK